MIFKEEGSSEWIKPVIQVSSYSMNIRNVKHTYDEVGSQCECHVNCIYLLCDSMMSHKKLLGEALNLVRTSLDSRNVHKICLGKLDIEIAYSVSAVSFAGSRLLAI